MGPGSRFRLATAVGLSDSSTTQNRRHPKPAAIKHKLTIRQAPDQTFDGLTKPAMTKLAAPIERWLTVAVRAYASDLHLIAGYPPTLRLNGTLSELAETQLEASDLDTLHRWLRFAFTVCGIFSLPFLLLSLFFYLTLPDLCNFQGNIICAYLRDQYYEATFARIELQENNSMILMYYFRH